MLGYEKEEIKKNMKNLQKDLPEKIKGFSDDIKDLFRSIFVVDKQKRISWGDFFKHPIFCHIDDEEELIIDTQDAGLQILRDRMNEKEFGDIMDNKSCIPKYFKDINEKKLNISSAPVKKSTEFLKNQITKIKNVNSLGAKSYKDLIKEQYDKIIKLSHFEINKYVYFWTLARRSRS